MSIWRLIQVISQLFQSRESKIQKILGELEKKEPLVIREGMLWEEISCRPPYEVLGAVECFLDKKFKIKRRPIELCPQGLATEVYTEGEQEPFLSLEAWGARGVDAQTAFLLFKMVGGTEVQVGDESVPYLREGSLNILYFALKFAYEKDFAHA